MQKEIEVMIKIDKTNVTMLLEKLNKTKPTDSEIKAFIDGFKLGKLAKIEKECLCNTCDVECDIRFHNSKNESHGTYTMVIQCRDYHQEECKDVPGNAL